LGNADSRLPKIVFKKGHMTQKNDQSKYSNPLSTETDSREAQPKKIRDKNGRGKFLGKFSGFLNLPGTGSFEI
jgi:hypothetical protein